MKTYATCEYHVSTKNSSIEIFNSIPEVVEYLEKDLSKGYSIDELVIKQIVKTVFEVDAHTFKAAHS